MIDAVERLGDPYVLLLIGAGGGQGANRVLELPYEPDARRLAGLLASCDAFVHANDAEPFGLIVLEAMACGLPVVGVNLGGVAESIDETVGQLASASSAQAFSKAVEGLFERDVQAIGRAARRRAVSRHDWARAFERLARLYADISGDPAFDASSSAVTQQ